MGDQTPRTGTDRRPQSTAAPAGHRGHVPLVRDRRQPDQRGSQRQDFINTDEIDGSTAFDVLTQGDYQEAAFFLNFQMPVGYRRELAGVRASAIGARPGIRPAGGHGAQSVPSAGNVGPASGLPPPDAQTQFNRWNASSREVASAEELFAGGKKSIDRLLDAQRRRAQSQRDYYQSLSDYNKALADVHFRKGSLLEYNNVYLAEGPWPEKAYWDALDRARERDASYYMNYGWTRPRVVSQGPVEQHTGTANETITDYPRRSREDEEKNPLDPRAVPREEPIRRTFRPDHNRAHRPVAAVAACGQALIEPPSPWQPASPVPFNWSSMSVTDEPLGTGVVRTETYME